MFMYCTICKHLRCGKELVYVIISLVKIKWLEHLKLNIRFQLFAWCGIKKNIVHFLRELMC